MFENPSIPENKAEKPEHIPSKEEVLAVIKNLAGEKELSERRILEDEQGVYVWELEVKTAEGMTEYGYMRKGSHRQGEDHGGALTTAIHATLFDADGMPYSGGNVAELVDGEWKFIQ